MHAARAGCAAAARPRRVGFAGAAGAHRGLVVRRNGADGPPAGPVLPDLGYAVPGAARQAATGRPGGGHPARRRAHLLETGGSVSERPFQCACGAQRVSKYSAPSDSSLMMSAADWIELTAPTDSPA